jgi:hypothetical protein
VCTAGSAQPQSIELQEPLQVGKQHLDFLSIVARLLVTTGLGHGTSHMACRFINTASDLAIVCLDSTVISLGNPRIRIAWTYNSSCRLW